jgi:hypothetical protein
MLEVESRLAFSCKASAAEQDQIDSSALLTAVLQGRLGEYSRYSVLIDY